MRWVGALGIAAVAAVFTPLAFAGPPGSIDLKIPEPPPGSVMFQYGTVVVKAVAPTTTGRTTVAVTLSGAAPAGTKVVVGEKATPVGQGEVSLSFVAVEVAPTAPAHPSGASTGSLIAVSSRPGPSVTLDPILWMGGDIAVSVSPVIFSAGRSHSVTLRLPGVPLTPSQTSAAVNRALDTIPQAGATWHLLHPGSSIPIDRNRFVPELKDLAAAQDETQVTMAINRLNKLIELPPAKAPGPTRYRGALRSGVYVGHGDGNDIKLTVAGRQVEITTGTKFRRVCGGPSTYQDYKRSPVVRSLPFHPGFHFFPVASDGSFSIKVLSSTLSGRFTSASTIDGTYRDGGSGLSECRGNHTFHLGLAHGSISEVVPPVMYDTYGEYLVKKFLLPAGYTFEPTDLSANSTSGGDQLSWVFTEGQWYDAAKGKYIGHAIGRNPDGWNPLSFEYAAMRKGLLPTSTISGKLSWNAELQRWEAGPHHEPVSKSGLGFTPLPLSGAGPFEFERDGSGPNASHTAWHICIYVHGSTAHPSGRVTLGGQTQAFALSEKGYAEVVFTVASERLYDFVITYTGKDGKQYTTGTNSSVNPELAAPPWGLPACTPPG